MTDLVKRLRAAHANSTQRILGSNIFEEAASALESLSAENADLRDDVLRLHREKMDYYERNILLLQQRNEAFERAAEVAEGEIDPEWPSDDLSSQARAIAAAIRNLSKES